VITTLADIVRVHGRERGDSPVLTFEGRTITYGEMDRRSSQAAQALAAAGVGAGDRIAYLDKNTPEYFELSFGAAKLNAVTVAVNWRLAPREIAQILDDAQAKVLLVGPDFVNTVEKIEGELSTVWKIVMNGGDHARWESYESWLGGQPADDPGVAATGDDVAFQLYTSGTTGLPKGVMLTNDNLFALLPGASEGWGFSPDMVNIGVMPLFHIAGSGWNTAVMFNGAPTVMTRDVDLPAILKAIPEHGVTHALFVPAVLQFLLSVPGVEDVDFSTLRTIVYGASPITDRVLVRAMEVFGADFIQVYGLTETTGAVTQLSPEDHDPEGNPDLLRSCGKPMHGVELRIVDAETGDDADEGAVGEVWIRSPQNMKGYWGKPEETAAALTEDNWMKTGDAGFLQDGYLYLYDRVKDMIVSGGENVYPAEVENVLMTHPAVADVAVIGVPHERWGETVKAVVVPAEGMSPTPEELLGFTREHLAHFKCPTSVDFADALPRNPSGKLLKRELREPYWVGHDRRIGG
jgi:long-chain acyl-CoA synthetase